MLSGASGLLFFSWPLVPLFSPLCHMQNAYEMGLIARGEYEKQRDRLLSDAPADATPIETSSAKEEEQDQPQQAQPSTPQEDFQEGEWAS